MQQAAQKKGELLMVFEQLVFNMPAESGEPLGLLFAYTSLSLVSLACIQGVLNTTVGGSSEKVHPFPITVYKLP
jgi:hypothetical protein